MPILPPRLTARHMAARTSSHEQGFSLLELMVVLAIMGIMLSLVGVRLRCGDLMSRGAGGLKARSLKFRPAAYVLAVFLP